MTPEEAWRELVRVTQEDDGPVARVCLTHLSVNVCRREDGCEWSEDHADVLRIMAWHRGRGAPRSERRTRVCAHCGQICGDYAGGLASATIGGKEEWLCHPNDPSRPDCYRRVTVWSEPLGALWEGHRPAGVEDIRRSGAGA